MLNTFFSIANLLNVALSVAMVGIMSVGMTAVILTGGIDLSVGSVLAVAGVVAALVAHAMAAVTNGPLAALAGILAGVGVGGVVGMINAGIITQLRVPPFLVTLALLTICRGLAFVVGGGRSVGELPDAFTWIGQSALAGIPVPVVLMLVLFAAGWFVLARTTWGRWIYAVGGNEEAAWLAGIRTSRVIAWTYVINGLLAGLAGVVLTARLGAGVPNAGLQYELDVIAAVVIGGTALTGGRGSVVGTLIGAVCIGALTNLLNLAAIDPELQRIVVGVVILIAVSADRVRAILTDRRKGRVLANM